jgi:hypothetical protein
MAVFPCMEGRETQGGKVETLSTKVGQEKLCPSFDKSVDAVRLERALTRVSRRSPESSLRRKFLVSSAPAISLPYRKFTGYHPTTF